MTRFALVFVVLACCGCAATPIITKSPKEMVPLNLPAPEPLDMSRFSGLKMTAAEDGSIKMTPEAVLKVMQAVDVLTGRVILLERDLYAYKRYYEPSVAPPAIVTGKQKPNR